MSGDIWTFLHDVDNRVFRYWIYKRVFAPLKQEKKYVYQSDYEDAFAAKGIIRECVQLPDGDLLLGFEHVYDDCGDSDLPAIIEYCKLSEIRLQYYAFDNEKNDDADGD